MFEKYKADLKRIEDDEMPEKRELKDYLGDCYKNLKVDSDSSNLNFHKLILYKLKWILLKMSCSKKQYYHYHQLAEAEDMITTDITHDKIENFWDMLEKSLADKKAAVQAEKDR